MKRAMWVYDFTPQGTNVLVRGNVRHWLISHRVPAYWLPRWRGWQVRCERVPDLLAWAEVDDIFVIVRSGQARMPSSPPASLSSSPRRSSSSAPRTSSSSSEGHVLPLTWGAA